VDDVLITQSTDSPTPVPSWSNLAYDVAIRVRQILDFSDYTSASAISDAVSSFLSVDLSPPANGSQLIKQARSYALNYNVSYILDGSPTEPLQFVGWNGTVTYSVSNAMNPTQLPTVVPTRSIYPSSLPTPLPSATPTPLPSTAPTVLPSLSPTPSPSISLVPTDTYEPTIDATPEPTQRRSSLCELGGDQTTKKVTCGATLLNVGNKEQNDVLGFGAKDSLFRIDIISPRSVRAAVCPRNNSLLSNSTQGNVSFSPYLWLYDGCPFNGSMPLLSTSDETTTTDVKLLNESLAGGYPLTTNCAVIAFDATTSWLSGRGGNTSLWLIVDGDKADIDLYFDMVVRCDAVPTLQPTPAPSRTPSPTTVPTVVSGRTNCVCMSAGMIAGIAEYCPLLATRFQDGCMRNVTRAQLVEYAGYVPVCASTASLSLSLI